LLDCSGGAQGDGDVGGGGVQRSPPGEQGLVRHGEPHPAVVIGVAEQQAAVDEDLQRDTQRPGQAGERDPPSGTPAGLIDGDQASESGQHLAFGQATGPYGLGERGLGMPGQRAADTTEVVVARQSQHASSGEAVS
jgi:hypothetical protein